MYKEKCMPWMKKLYSLLGFTLMATHLVMLFFHETLTVSHNHYFFTQQLTFDPSLELLDSQRRMKLFQMKMEGSQYIYFYTLVY